MLKLILEARLKKKKATNVVFENWNKVIEITEKDELQYKKKLPLPQQFCIFTYKFTTLKLKFLSNIKSQTKSYVSHTVIKIKLTSTMVRQ